MMLYATNITIIIPRTIKDINKESSAIGINNNSGNPKAIAGIDWNTKLLAAGVSSFG